MELDRYWWSGRRACRAAGKDTEHTLCLTPGMSVLVVKECSRGR